MGIWARACLAIMLSSAGISSAWAEAFHISNEDVALTVEAGPWSESLISLAGNTAESWQGMPLDAWIDHVRVVNREQKIVWRWDRSATRQTKTSLQLVYESAEPKLELISTWSARSQRGPVEHSIRIRNESGRNLSLPLQDSLRFQWKLEAGQAAEEMWVEKGAGGPSDVGVHRNTINDGYRWTGTSSTYAHPAAGEQREMIPYLLVRPGQASQPGWYLGIEFSGRTRIGLRRRGEILEGEAGLNPDPGPYETKLAPGESFVDPTVFLGAFHGDADDAANGLRRWVRVVLNHPETVADPQYPLLVNNSWGSGMAIHEAQARSMIRDSAELGFEMFHLDAGWFRGVGDWYPSAEKFPHGLAPIADYAHSKGLRFGLWMDWAQASLDPGPGSLYVNDPVTRNWLVADPPAGWKQGDEFKGITIDLGLPAAHDWAAKTVERVILEDKLDMLEHDGYVVAQGCDRRDHPHAAPANGSHVYEDSGFLWADGSNDTDVSYHATRAYYDIHEQVRRQHPHLLLEICNDGGRMVDFGSAAHGDYFSISDAYDPLSNRRAFYDAAYVLPPAMLETYVMKVPAPSIGNFLYVLRSGMMGWFTLMLDTTAWSPQEHAAARDALTLYKQRLRPLIRNADLYHVSPRPDGMHWDGMEYYDAASGRGAVFAFRGSGKGESSYRFSLRGVDEQARYRVSFHDHSSADVTMTGRELMQDGLTVALAQPDTSEIVFLEKNLSR